MQEIGAFDAKTHFAQLLNAVEQGEEIIVTRHGKQVAIIKPIGDTQDKLSRQQRARAAIKRLRKGTTLGKDLSLKSMVEEGRR